MNERLLLGKLQRTAKDRHGSKADRQLSSGKPGAGSRRPQVAPKLNPFGRMLAVASHCLSKLAVCLSPD